MGKMKTNEIEIARVVRKHKSPYMKSTIVLMSDGSSWERLTCRSSSGKKIKGDWSLISRTPISGYTRDMFLRVFTRGGWKEKSSQA